MSPWTNREVRECVTCHRTATPGGRNPDEPKLITICFTLSGRGPGKHRLVRARSITLCDVCLEKALKPPVLGYGPEARQIFAGFTASVSESYRTLLSEEPEESCR